MSSLPASGSQSTVYPGNWDVQIPEERSKHGTPFEATETSTTTSNNSVRSPQYELLKTTEQNTNQRHECHANSNDIESNTEYSTSFDATEPVPASTVFEPLSLWPLSNEVIKTEPEENPPTFDVDCIKSEKLLYADHEISDGIVIGPTEINRTEPGNVPDSNSLESNNELPFYNSVEEQEPQNELQCTDSGELICKPVPRRNQTQIKCKKNGETDIPTGPSTCQQRKINTHKYECELCHKWFTRSDKLSQHRIKYCIFKRFTCNICKKMFMHKTSLKRHFESHKTEVGKVNELDIQSVRENGEEIKKYRCKQCSKICHSKWHLFQHEALHKRFAAAKRKNSQQTNNPKKHYTCEPCNKVFTTIHYFNKHIGSQYCLSNINQMQEANKDEIRNESEEGRQTNILPSKENKMLIDPKEKKHTESKQFKCEPCNKVCRTNLSEHTASRSCILNTNKIRNDPEEKVHTERSEQFKCELCGKICKTNYHLNAHRNSLFCIRTRYNMNKILNGPEETMHTDRSTQFKCDLCNKVLRSNYHLNVHRGSRFCILNRKIMNKILNDSEETVHTDRFKFKCDLCNKICTSNDHLNEHRGSRSCSAKKQGGNKIRKEPEKERQINTLSKQNKILTSQKRKGHTDKSKQYRYKLCEKVCTSKNRLNEHRGRQSSISATKKCHNQRRNVKKTRMSPAKQLKCKLCNKICVTNWHLIKHQAKHSHLHNKKIINVNKLGLKVRNKQVPLASKNFVSQFECKICGKLYKYMPNMLKHFKNCSAEQNIDKKAVLRIYSCDHCDKKFKNRQNRSRHTNSQHSPLVLLRCDNCSKTFKYKDSLVNHIQNHCAGYEINPKRHYKKCSSDKKLGKKGVLGIYSCDQCDIKFTSIKARSRHTNSQHVPVVLRCDSCSNTFKYKDTLINHIQYYCVAYKNKQKRHLKKCRSDKNLGKKEAKRIYSCEQCDQKFTSIKARSRHTNSKHVPVVLRCDNCSNMFKYKDILINHIQYYCVGYKKNPKNRNHLDTHNILEGKVAVNHMDMLNLLEGKVAVVVLEKLKMDEVTKYCQIPSSPNSNIELLTCNICEMKFKYEDILREHLAKHDLEAETSGIKPDEKESIDEKGSLPKQSAQCQKRNKVIHNKTQLVEHEMDYSHLNLMPLNDKLTQVELKKPAMVSPKRPLVQHQSPISQSKITKRIKYQCKVCKKFCRTKWNLIKHQGTHKQLLKCDICEAIFEDKLDFQTHLKHHSMEFQILNKAILQASCETKTGNYSCDQCNEKFQFVSELSSHQATHLNQFICDVCEKSFKFKVDLIKHLNTHTLLKNTEQTDVIPESKDEEECYYQSPESSPPVSPFTGWGGASPTSEQFNSETTFSTNMLVSHQVNYDTLENIEKEEKPELETVESEEINKSKHKVTDSNDSFDGDASANSFNNECSLKNHLSDNSSADNMNHPSDQCNQVCEKNSKCKSKPLNHRPTPLGPYTCDVCDKKFKYKHTLKYHYNLFHILRNMQKDSSVIQPELTGEKDKQNPSNSRIKHYQCKVCNKMFVHKTDFFKHKSMHDRSKNFACSKCSQTFSYDNELAIHMLTHGNAQNITCDICNKMFTRGKSLTKHIYSVHRGIKPFSCDDCGKAFSRKGILADHQRIHHKEKKPDICTICYKTFTSKHYLARHQITHKGLKPFSCDICKKMFAYKDSVIKHMWIHSAIKPFSCDICNKKFNYKSTLNQHLLYHSGIKRFKCEICNKKYTDQSGLRKHMRGHVKKKILTCKDCGRQFMRTNTYDRHVLVHKGIKEYQCHICGKSFVHKCIFTKHISTHKGVVLFKCTNCGKKCKSELHLLRHSRIHSTFTCDICAENFTIKELLIKHIIAHNSLRQICHVCNKRFNDKNDLTKHMLDHSEIKDEESYVCDICSKTFDDKIFLVRHLCDHETVSHVCEICGEVFQDKNDLEEHILQHANPVDKIQVEETYIDIKIQLEDTDAPATDNDVLDKNYDTGVNDSYAQVKDSDAQAKDSDAQAKDNDAQVRDNDAQAKDNDAQVRDNDAQV